LVIIWQPFQEEQVIVRRQGMIWAGTVSIFGLPVRGALQTVSRIPLMKSVAGPNLGCSAPASFFAAVTAFAIAPVSGVMPKTE
jgi:hypothetical protein